MRPSPGRVKGQQMPFHWCPTRLSMAHHFYLLSTHLKGLPHVPWVWDQETLSGSSRDRLRQRINHVYWEPTVCQTHAKGSIEITSFDCCVIPLPIWETWDSGEHKFSVNFYLPFTGLATIMWKLCPIAYLNTEDHNPAHSFLSSKYLFFTLCWVLRSVLELQQWTQQAKFLLSCSLCSAESNTQWTG